MRKMIFTTDIPTEFGAYWMRVPNSARLIVVHFAEDGDGRMVMATACAGASPADRFFSDCIEAGAEFCGPLLGPGEYSPRIDGPNWSYAPSWANWWAQDWDGTAYWFAAKPLNPGPTDSVWSADELGETPWEMDRNFHRSLIKDWRNSLRRRPVQSKLNP